MLPLLIYCILFDLINLLIKCISKKKKHITQHTQIEACWCRIVLLVIIMWFPWQKGCGYHLDLLWVGILMATCSFMGLPWYVAATVISIAHIDSLKMESESSAPGEQPQFLGVRLVHTDRKRTFETERSLVMQCTRQSLMHLSSIYREQRMTGILVFALTGVSIFLAPVLKVWWSTCLSVYSFSMNNTCFCSVWQCNCFLLILMLIVQKTLYCWSSLWVLIRSQYSPKRKCSICHCYYYMYICVVYATGLAV